MSKKKPTKKPVTKKAVTKKVATKKVAPITSVKKNPVTSITVSSTPIDEAALQAKYQECLSILEQLANGITLGLTISSEFDDKEPIEIIQYNLDKYKEFSKLSPEEMAALQLESGDLLKQLQEAFPDMEIVSDEIQTTQVKKELMN